MFFGHFLRIHGGLRAEKIEGGRNRVLLCIGSVMVCIG